MSDRFRIALRIISNYNSVARLLFLFAGAHGVASDGSQKGRQDGVSLSKSPRARQVDLTPWLGTRNVTARSRAENGNLMHKKLCLNLALILLLAGTSASVANSQIQTLQPAAARPPVVFSAVPRNLSSISPVASSPRCSRFEDSFAPKRSSIEGWAENL